MEVVAFRRETVEGELGIKKALFVPRHHFNMLLALKKNYPDHLPQDGKNDDKEIKEGGRKKKRPDFTLGMTGQERRTTLQVLILQAGIRIRHFFHSWFFLKPIFSSRHAF